MSLGKEVVFLNGRFLAADRARISPLDRGFLYGDGLFETIRIYAGLPFALEEHLRRLRAAGKRIRLPIPRGVSWWRGTIAALLARNRLDREDASVRVTVTRGIGDGILLPQKPTPTILMMARALAPDLEEHRRNGVNVTLLGFHPGTDGLLGGLKTTAYLTAAIGKTLARERAAFEGIYQTKSGEILEGTTSNLFVVRRGRLTTPPLSKGILPGTTRDRVISLARSAGIPAGEGPVPVEALLGADEAFLTASTIEVVPIRRVGTHEIGRLDNPLTRRIERLYCDDRDRRLRRRRK